MTDYDNFFAASKDVGNRWKSWFSLSLADDEQIRQGLQTLADSTRARLAETLSTPALLGTDKAFSQLTQTPWPEQTLSTLLFGCLTASCYNARVTLATPTAGGHLIEKNKTQWQHLQEDFFSPLLAKLTERMYLSLVCRALIASLPSRTLNKDALTRHIVHQLNASGLVEVTHCELSLGDFHSPLSDWQHQYHQTAYQRILDQLESRQTCVLELIYQWHQAPAASAFFLTVGHWQEGENSHLVLYSLERESLESWQLELGQDFAATIIDRSQPRAYGWRLWDIPELHNPPCYGFGNKIRNTWLYRKIWRLARWLKPSRRFALKGLSGNKSQSSLR